MFHSGLFRCTFIPLAMCAPLLAGREAALSLRSLSILLASSQSPGVSVLRPYDKETKICRETNENKFLINLSTDPSARGPAKSGTPP